MYIMYCQLVTAHPLPKDLESNQPERCSNRAVCSSPILMVFAVNVEDVCSHRQIHLINAVRHVQGALKHYYSYTKQNMQYWWDIYSVNYWNI